MNHSLLRHHLQTYLITDNCLIKNTFFKSGTHLGINPKKNAKENFFSTFNTSGNIILKMLKHFYRV